VMEILGRRIGVVKATLAVRPTISSRWSRSAAASLLRQRPADRTRRRMP
jgi:hypothetical protein